MTIKICIESTYFQLWRMIRKRMRSERDWEGFSKTVYHNKTMCLENNSTRKNRIVVYNFKSGLNATKNRINQKQQSIKIRIVMNNNENVIHIPYPSIWGNYINWRIFLQNSVPFFQYLHFSLFCYLFGFFAMISFEMNYFTHRSF